ncbi:GntR family transcriptional regulator [Aquipuribacter hungaricus]|uniref:GntR family transcriptional regulator n=2 Tax=Aquipuribacter hungaricus TaxID=545624 RepID=A0ABV7WJX0_9MICO
MRARIDAGDFDGPFPGEHAIAAEYGVSRHTVREALRRIRHDGLVLAARGRAPRLADDGVLHQPLGALYSLFRSVEDSGRTQRSVVRALDVRRDPDAAARLSLPADADLTYLERLRLADDDPLALDQVWLPATPTTALLEADFSHTALYDELRARCAIVVSGGVETIRAVLVDEREADVLHLVAPAPAFLIERTGHVTGAPFELRRTVVRSDGFALTAEYSSQDGYQLTQGRGQTG